MKNKNHVRKYVIIGIALLACNAPKKASQSKNDSATAVSIQAQGKTANEDGRSYETAVVIHEKSETAGVTAEYQWIRDHYSNYKVVQQSLNSHGKKPYDIITIQFSDERKQEVYFDISAFFGKF
jgi:hypothetical protein